MGRKLLMFTQSMLVFFGTGVTAAILSAAGTTPVLRESFIILKTTGHREAKHDLNRQVGMESTMEVAAFRNKIKWAKIWEKGARKIRDTESRSWQNRSNAFESIDNLGTEMIKKSITKLSWGRYIRGTVAFEQFVNGMKQFSGVILIIVNYLREILRPDRYHLCLIFKYVVFPSLVMHIQARKTPTSLQLMTSYLPRAQLDITPGSRSYKGHRTGFYRCKWAQTRQKNSI